MTGTKKKTQKAKRINLKSVEIETKIFVDEATGHLKTGIYDKALELYSKALELSPNDKNALIARSRCHLLMGEPQKALGDAESALLRGNAKDPNNAKALYSKAEALYHLGDFELSLVFYYRGMKIRPEFDQFRLGVQKAKEAIQNILGDAVPVAKKTSSRSESRRTNASENLTAGLPANHPMDPSKTKEAEKLVDENKNLKVMPPKDTSLSIQKRRPINKSSNRDSQLFGHLSVDKKYLQNLVKRPDLKAAHQDSAQHIITHAEEGINFLKSRQEFWNQQRAAQHSKPRRNNY